MPLRDHKPDIVTKTNSTGNHSLLLIKQYIARHDSCICFHLLHKDFRFHRLTFINMLMLGLFQTR